MAEDRSRTGGESVRVVARESNGAVAFVAPQRQDLVAMPHALPVDAVLGALGVEAERGLDEPRAAALLEQHGPNRLVEPPPIPSWRRFLDQFRALVIWILIVASIIAGALGEWSDTLAIMAIVLLNGLLGFLQEERAGKALAALR